MLALFVTLQTLVAGRIDRDDKGATAVEYGLMVALIAGAIIVAVTALGLDLSELFGGVGGELDENTTVIQGS